MRIVGRAADESLVGDEARIFLSFMWAISLRTSAIASGPIPSPGSSKRERVVMDGFPVS
jgi:hypothetical protein